MIRTGHDVARWVCCKLDAACQEGAEGIGLVRNGELVAGVCYDNYRKRSIMAHIVIEDRITPYFLFAIFHYPFVHLGVDKIIAPIVQTNSKSIRLVSKMGFKREATLSDAAPEGDIYLYTIKRPCRFTGEQYEQRIRSASRT